MAYEQTVSAPKSTTVPKKLREILRDKAIKQIEFAFAYKRKRVKQWQSTDRLYALLQSEEKRQEIEEFLNQNQIVLPKMSGFIKTWLSKIDNPPNMEFRHGKTSTMKKAELLTSLLKQDGRPANMNLDFKDLLGKKSAGKYGRVIFKLYGSSKPYYKTTLDLVSCYLFGIDPAGGGEDVENAQFMGERGINKRAWELRAGVKSGKYIKEEVKELLKDIEADQPATEEDKQMESDPDKADSNRYFAISGNSRVLKDPDLIKLTEWYMTHEGQRFYLLIEEETEKVVRCEYLTTIFEDGCWPYASWAADPDSDEFWSLAPADEVRGVFVAQITAIRQMLDNNQQINRPMIFFDLDAVEDPTLLKYRDDGLVPFKGGTNIDKAVKFSDPKPLENGIKIYDVMENIAATSSGVGPAQQGMAQEDKVGIYEGNVAQAEDRLALLARSYTNCYARLGLLYYYSVKQHLNSRRAVQIVGPNGIEFRWVTKTSITLKKTEGEYEIYVSSTQNQRLEDVEKRNKLAFITKNKDNARINQQFLDEAEARIVGFDQEDIDQMFDVETWASREVLAECERDLELVMETSGDVLPNRKANLAYLKKMTRFLDDQAENLSELQQLRIMNYIKSIIPIVQANTGTAAVGELAKAGRLPGLTDFGLGVDSNAAPAGTPEPNGTGEPTDQGAQNNDQGIPNADNAGQPPVAA